MERMLRGSRERVRDKRFLDETYHVLCFWRATSAIFLLFPIGSDIGCAFVHKHGDRHL
jgi:hypothetical protein